jgi:competence protein ComEC
MAAHSIRQPPGLPGRDGPRQAAQLRDTGWWLVGAGLAWLLGLWLQMQQAGLWPLVADQALVGAAMTGLAAAARWPGPRCGLVALLAVAALAVGSTGWRADVRLAQRLDTTLEGQDLLVTGVVASLPQVGPAGTRFLFTVESAALRGQAVVLPPQLALGWYTRFQDETWLDDPRTELRAGQRWRLPLRLKRPHGSLNPEGFDVELLWFEQGVGATGYVRVVKGWNGAELLGDRVGHPVDRLRQTLRDALQRQVGDARIAGVLAALTVGDQAAIERADWELFRTTGIAHLVSISGVHVTMFAWLAAGLAGWAWRRSPGLMQRLPAPTAGRWLGLLAAAGYALLAGWGVPAQRTVLMLLVAVLLRSAGWRWPWALVLLVAAVVVTAADPWALLQPGFWLSFTAVGILMASEPAAGAPPPAAGARGLLSGHLRGQAVATLGLAPLSLVFFQQLSLVGVLANLVAIPLVTLLVTPLALLGMLVPLLWTPAAWLVQALVWGLGWLAQVPLAVWTVPAAPGWLVAAAALGAVLAVLPAPWALRWLALPLVLPLLWPPVARPAHGQFEVLAADVGQGTALLLRTRAHLLVYDAGPLYSRESDAAQRVLLPLLRARGEPQIDLLMLSHRDSDHVGGAASLLAGHAVRALSTSLEAEHPLLVDAARGLPHTPCRAGQRWDWDGVQFELLHPAPDDVPFAVKPNAVSCVLRVVDAQGRSLLVTGDIEAPQEAALLRRTGAALASTMLVVPHHGSRTSSTAAFLDAVQPSVAVVQAGYRSRFGHPAPDVLARYAERGIAVVRTDSCGAWLWHDGAAACTRDVRRRYWHAAAPVGGAIVAKASGPGAPPP